MLTLTRKGISSISFLAVLMLPLTTSAQEGSREQRILDSMKTSINAIQTKVQGDRRAKALCKDIIELIGKLGKTHEDVAETGSGETYTTTTTEGRIVNDNSARQMREQHVTRISDAYIAGLQSDSELLASLVDAGTTSETRLETLDVVKDDLQLKYKFMSAGNFIEEITTTITASTDPRPSTVYTKRAGDVLVTVQTLNGNQDVVGYRVLFVPQGWAKDPNHFGSFSTLSSPTRGEYITPGPYFVWSVKGATTTERNLIRIGSQGPNQLIQIAVPNN
jgi:hypothetical protein